MSSSSDIPDDASAPMSEYTPAKPIIDDYCEGILCDDGKPSPQRPVIAEPIRIDCTDESRFGLGLGIGSDSYFVNGNDDRLRGAAAATTATNRNSGSLYPSLLFPQPAKQAAKRKPPFLLDSFFSTTTAPATTASAATVDSNLPASFRSFWTKSASTNSDNGKNHNRLSDSEETPPPAAAAAAATPAAVTPATLSEPESNFIGAIRSFWSSKPPQASPVAADDPNDKPSPPAPTAAAAPPPSSSSSSTTTTTLITSPTTSNIKPDELARWARLQTEWHGDILQQKWARDLLRKGIPEELRGRIWHVLLFFLCPSVSLLLSFRLHLPAGW